jgi:single-strand DNA-binding protein
MAFNRVILEGNLTRDPEQRKTQSGISVTNFGLAVNRVRSKNDEVDFFDCTAWRELGDTLAKFKGKGDPILLEGRLQQSTFQDKNGNNRSKVEVVADNIQFLGRGPGNGGNGGGTNSPLADDDDPFGPEDIDF